MSAKEIARDVVCIEAGIANCYLVGNRRAWVLIDSGTGGHAEEIRRVAWRRFGRDPRPEAILLTHGHFDHAGSASELADHWDVPIYAHERELPFVDGRSEYPPPDPTVGGFMSFVVRFIPARNNTVNLGERVQAYDDLDKLPGLKGWRAIETPGHTPGHVSFFREKDRVLLAGDAFTTVNQDSMIDMVTKRKEVCRPPVYYTPDWHEAHESVKKLADLDPEVLVAGHGVPMRGPHAMRQLERLARKWPAPGHGRYVPEPVVADQNGIVYLPPPATDPLPKIAMGVGAATVAAVAGTSILLRRRGDVRRVAGRAGIIHSEVA